jgi:Protein of unknown function (DUF3617)
MTSRVYRLAAAMLVLLGSSAALAADAADQPGDLWQVTSKMVMEGMPMAMPARMSQVCAPKVWTQPPAGGGDGQHCTRSDFTMNDGTATWTETCSNPAMTGHGEMTRHGADAYTGAIHFESADGNMTINIDGQRVGGCDNPM